MARNFGGVKCWQIYRRIIKLLKFLSSNSFILMGGESLMIKSGLHELEKKPQGSRNPYLKLTPTQNAIVGKRAAEHG